MRRSFTDRMFAGVCGGLARTLRINAWLVRLVWVALTIASGGIFAVLYLLLWWLTPQESLVERRRGVSFLIVLLLITLAAVGWYARDAGVIVAADGSPIFWQSAIVVASGFFLLRQIAIGGRGR